MSYKYYKGETEMKVSEVINIDPQQQRADAMNKVADNAKRQAKLATANLKMNKAKQQLQQAQKPI